VGISVAITWRNDEALAPTSKSRIRARALRHRSTEPESKLWWHLRHRMPTEGTHFRRQVPIGPYIADFCCLKAKLIVEVDGNQHGYSENIPKDARRTAYLTSHGFSVLRFSNQEVMTETTAVLDAILQALTTSTPTPNPSPQGGGEQSGARR
jgi:very-short-patch-repair endonuclease